MHGLVCEMSFYLYYMERSFIMTKRKYDFPFPIAGGTSRQTTSTFNNGRFEAGYKLIDPTTTCPYTNAALASALKKRQAESPALATIIEAELVAILRKVDRYPKAEFMLLCCGKVLHHP